MPTAFDPAPIWLSLRVATVATGLVVVIGLPIARALARKRGIAWDAVACVFAMPLVLPPTVLGYLLLLCFGRQGPLGKWLEQQFGVVLVFHWIGAVVASGVASFPLFFLSARSAFAGVDRALENAARLLGRGELSVFATVTLPLAWRGLVAGAVLCFVRALGDFGATLMVAGDIPGRTRTASLAIYDAVNRYDHTSALLYSASVALLALVALWVVQWRLTPRVSR